MRGHSEFGHIYVRRHPADKFDGSCPFHGDCLEGLASGSAISARRKLQDRDHSVFTKKLVAYYFAQAAYTLSLTLAPSVIVFGGGVPYSYDFLSEVQSKYLLLWRGYLDPNARASLEMARTGIDSALIGAAHIARRLCLCIDL